MQQDPDVHAATGGVGQQALRTRVGRQQRARVVQVGRGWWKSNTSFGVSAAGSAAKPGGTAKKSWEIVIVFCAPAMSSAARVNTSWSTSIRTWLLLERARTSPVPSVTPKPVASASRMTRSGRPSS